MGKFRSFVAGLAMVAASACVSTAASAHDYDRWGGLYIGGSVGGAWSSVDWSYYNDPSQQVSRSPSGLMAGIHTGIQHQWNHVVIGAEMSYSGGTFDKIDDRGPDAPAFASRFDSYARIHDLFTVGGRLGWAFSPQWMIYGTGGYANSRVETAFISLSNPASNDFRSNRTDGWFVGGGLEFALTKNWIVGVDYKHVELDTVLQGPSLAVTDVSRYVSPTVDTVTARLTFKLGRPAEVHESMK